MGPIMVGPSSSHTAGAARIGRVARHLLGVQPSAVEILLHGSFAATGHGHGTDRALVAGLLDLAPDDPALPLSFSLAERAGMAVTIRSVELRGAHPNTALLRMTHPRRAHAGGLCLLPGRRSDSGQFHRRHGGLLLRGVPHPDRPQSDKPGIVSEVSYLLSTNQANIATMQLYRDRRGGWPSWSLSDTPIPRRLVELLGKLDGIVRCAYLNLTEVDS